jgi:DNA-binding PadR family transcriptional regulator
MSRNAQTEVAVLGGLSMEPMSGYALRQAIKETLGHFWHESFGQIYPTINELEEGGFIVRLDNGKASGNVYRITASGRRRLRARLRESFDVAPPRNPVLLRLFFGRIIGKAECLQLIDDVRTRALASLAEYRSIEDQLRASTDVDAPFMLLTVIAGRHSAQASVAWADEAFSILNAVH